MLGIDPVKLFWIVVTIIVIIWVFNDPQMAAADVKGIISTFKDIAMSILTFIKTLFRG